MYRLARAALCSLLFLVPFSRLAHADTVALSSFSGGNPATSGTDQLYGWIFTVNAPITVTSLGVYDYGGAAGLSVSHDVGIYDESTKALLGSVTVPAGTGGTLLDGFDFESVSPFSLAGGDTYVIVMTMPENNSDFQYIQVPSETTASQITYDNSAFDNSSSLAFPAPGGNGDFAPGIFGPNFTFSTGTTVTPEPSSIALLGTGLLSMTGFVRRRLRRA
jgi:hypothetical protein